jgi:hypothetical protein
MSIDYEIDGRVARIAIDRRPLSQPQRRPDE